MIITLKNQADATDTFDTSTTINAQAKQHRSNQPAAKQKNTEQNAHYLLTFSGTPKQPGSIQKNTEQNAHYLLTTCIIAQTSQRPTRITSRSGQYL